ncbi:hypothetical protein BX600DRAFT_224447 [Xylariales sp. PMI_506]|nr:hypothetical protein BX600DRAFT_224447 [Xylariales sp. PMI_506]
MPNEIIQSERCKNKIYSFINRLPRVPGFAMLPRGLQPLPLGGRTPGRGDGWITAIRRLVGCWSENFLVQISHARRLSRVCKLLWCLVGIGHRPATRSSSEWTWCYVGTWSAQDWAGEPRRFLWVGRLAASHSDSGLRHYFILFPTPSLKRLWHTYEVCQL